MGRSQDSYSQAIGETAIRYRTITVPAKPLRIAWLGPAPGGYSGVRGVAAELLGGLAQRGHQIDCFLPAAEGQSTVQIAGSEGIEFGTGNLAFGENVTFIWGTSRWQWNRWYSRGRVAAFASGALARSVASLRLRREIARRHHRQPYDLIYQFSSIETPAVPRALARSVPLVIHPETHIAGELRWLIAERRLALRCQPPYVFAAVVVLMFLRSLVQQRAIRRASLLICISSVFRDHLVRDYRFPAARTVVVPNPVCADRFPAADDRIGEPPVVLVLGRISARKGIEDVIAVTKVLLQRGIDIRLRVVGGPSLWSDYTKLLDDLPEENAEYLGSASASEVARLLQDSDLLLQASKYEPFGLTVGEALAAGVPVVATSEVGAAEGVDRSVLSEVRPSDVPGMASAITEMIERLRHDPTEIRSLARAQARELFAIEVVCERISQALEQLLEDPGVSVPCTTKVA
jgi:glycosyltransferase involved in cell wall biosynthesis